MDDALGDRMKELEGREAARRTLPLLPVCIRLDGKGFSKYTKNFTRPYDKRMSDLMVDTTRFLVEESNACVGYTQSDEISLILYSSTNDSQIFFDGKIQKITSVLASMCTAYFNRNVAFAFGQTAMPMAFFDCRVWDVPTKEEAANEILWRELDATKNAVSMAARHYFSHAELMNKHGGEMQEMMWSKHKVNFNDFPAFFKRGTFVQRRRVPTKLYTPEEIAQLPEKHHARLNPNLEIDRAEVRTIDMPPFMKVINRTAVIFDGAEPLLQAPAPKERSEIEIKILAKQNPEEYVRLYGHISPEGYEAIRNSDFAL